MKKFEEAALEVMTFGNDVITTSSKTDSSERGQYQCICENGGVVYDTCFADCSSDYNSCPTEVIGCSLLENCPLLLQCEDTCPTECFIDGFVS